MSWIAEKSVRCSLLCAFFVVVISMLSVMSNADGDGDAVEGDGAVQCAIQLPESVDGQLKDPVSLHVVAYCKPFPAGTIMNIFVHGEVAFRERASGANVSIPVTKEMQGDVEVGVTTVDAGGRLIGEAYTSVEIRRRDIDAGKNAVNLASRMGEGGDMWGAIALLDDAAIEDDWLSYDIKYMSGFFRHIMGASLEGFRDLRLAVSLTPDDPYDCAALTLMMQMITHFCEWSRWGEDVERFQSRFHEKLAINETILVPFFHYTLGIAAADTLRQARVISNDVATRVNSAAEGSSGDLSREEQQGGVSADLSVLADLGDGPLRIGLFNMAGFSGHDLSIGRFLQAYLSNLNKSNASGDRDREVHVYCYSYSKVPDSGNVFERCMQGCHAFHDVSLLDFEAAVDLIRSHKLHIFIETAGFSWSAFKYTRRNMHFRSFGFDILAKRVAPIQTEFHGYPGTHGADFVDSVTLDATCVTPETSIYMHEAVWFHPSCYLVSEHPIIHRFVFGEYAEGEVPVDPVPTRADLGFTEDEFIFATFNREFKYTPEIFGVWMRILLRVPESKLWLIRFEPLAEPFLRQWAAAYGIGSERLVFTEKFPTRQLEYGYKGLADLFLDTPLFNGHTTVLDALWCGVPVLTVPGETVASRVAAAALIGGSFPEGVMRNIDDYEDTAVTLAALPDAIDYMRMRADEGRRHGAMWDLRSWTRSMTSLHHMAADAAVARGNGAPMMHVIGASASAVTATPHAF